MEDKKRKAHRGSFYEVEEIMDRRFNGGRVEYLIKWKDYDETANKWVKENDLRCPKILDDFIKRRKENYLNAVVQLEKAKKDKIKG